MKPEFQSRRLFGITRAQGKMLEFDIDPADFIKIPEGDSPEALFLLAIGTLGDAAAAINNANPNDVSVGERELDFAASFFDAFLSARFRDDLDEDVLLLASAAYFLAKRPGSSLVLARHTNANLPEVCMRALAWLLRAKWDQLPVLEGHRLAPRLGLLAAALAGHFLEGSDAKSVLRACDELRATAYGESAPYDLLLVDLICAVSRLRLAASAWLTLPGYSGITSATWRPAIMRKGFPKELWPSQMRLGEAGLFGGRSGVVQMPTSAGKTRALELIIRSAFLGGRTSFAVVVAPFRALCHEIAATLRVAFADDEVGINELSDVMQSDYAAAFEVGAGANPLKSILVVTPEKFLFVLRQMPSIIERIGVVVYDEGHQFDSGTRGITYELLLTEIKALLPETAQSILVSAVINNAEAIGRWLVGESVQIVDGSGLLPTARSVAFASWAEQLGQLIFFESDDYNRFDYFVPRLLQPSELAKRPKEGKKVFPKKGDAREIALFLGLRLSHRGAVAIFCGRKDSAELIVRRAVEIYGRGYQQRPPATSSDKEEISALVELAGAHFGNDSEEKSAAELGLFVHHGNTPEGMRLAIEYAMQKGKIKFVACTSTLAQGVNLPIRYLIVSTVYQAGERIKVRDFQNLIGRAGRAGMHTEGLVIFTDTQAYDRRRSESWKFETSTNLLRASNAEAITSSLLSIIQPIGGRYASVHVSVEVLCDLLFDTTDMEEWSAQFVRDHRRAGLITDSVAQELRGRRQLLASIESYLMANRGEGGYEDFRTAAQSLSTRALAYSLSSLEERDALEYLFGAIADRVEQVAPDPGTQKVYARTLLGVSDASAVDAWVAARVDALVQSDGTGILALVWPLFQEMRSPSLFFSRVSPPELPIRIARDWIRGLSYRSLIDRCREMDGSRPWGKTTRKLGKDSILSFVEDELGFDCALLVGAVIQLLLDKGIQEGDVANIALLQKQMKYGLPDKLSISIYESGYADRVIAQRLRDALLSRGYPMETFVRAIVPASVIREALSPFPSYFKSLI